MDFWHVLALLIAGHCLADYPLQGDFLAKAKNHTNPIPGIPWYQALGAHAIIHGGFVGVITGSLFLGILETIVHTVIDRKKCEGAIDYNTDQALHVACKVVWATIAVSTVDAETLIWDFMFWVAVIIVLALVALSILGEIVEKFEDWSRGE